MGMHVVPRVSLPLAVLVLGVVVGLTGAIEVSVFNAADASWGPSLGCLSGLPCYSRSVSVSQVLRWRGPSRNSYALQVTAAPSTSTPATLLGGRGVVPTQFVHDVNVTASPSLVWNVDDCDGATYFYARLVNNVMGGHTNFSLLLTQAPLPASGSDCPCDLPTAYSSNGVDYSASTGSKLKQCYEALGADEDMIASTLTQVELMSQLYVFTDNLSGSGYPWFITLSLASLHVEVDDSDWAFHHSLHQAVAEAADVNLYYTSPEPYASVWAYRPFVLTITKAVNGTPEVHVQMNSWFGQSYDSWTASSVASDAVATGETLQRINGVPVITWLEALGKRLGWSADSGARVNAGLHRASACRLQDLELVSWYVDDVYSFETFNVSLGSVFMGPPSVTVQDVWSRVRDTSVATSQGDGVAATQGKRGQEPLSHSNSGDSPRGSSNYWPTSAHDDASLRAPGTRGDDGVVEGRVYRAVGEARDVKASYMSPSRTGARVPKRRRRTVLFGTDAVSCLLPAADKLVLRVTSFAPQARANDMSAWRQEAVTVVDNCVQHAQAQALTSLVVDVRSNPGGDSCFARFLAAQLVPAWQDAGNLARRDSPLATRGGKRTKSRAKAGTGKRMSTFDCSEAFEPSYVSDGYCDESNNVHPCWDGGDCCPGTCVPAEYECGYNGYDCVVCDSPSPFYFCRASSVDCSTIGNSVCNQENNGELCYDGGDCCSITACCLTNSCSAPGGSACDTCPTCSGNSTCLDTRLPGSPPISLNGPLVVSEFRKSPLAVSIWAAGAPLWGTPQDHVNPRTMEPFASNDTCSFASSRGSVRGGSVPPPDPDPVLQDVTFGDCTDARFRAEWLADGYCDDVNNKPDCWDQGDCCVQTCDPSTAVYGQCGPIPEEDQPDFNCLDPRFAPPPNPIPRFSEYSQLLMYPRCTAALSALSGGSVPFRSYRFDTLSLLTDGLCTGECAVFAESLVWSGHARALTVGGTGDAMDPTALSSSCTLDHRTWRDVATLLTQHNVTTTGITQLPSSASMGFAMRGVYLGNSTVACSFTRLEFSSDMFTSWALDDATDAFYVAAFGAVSTNTVYKAHGGPFTATDVSNPLCNQATTPPTSAPTTVTQAPSAAVRSANVVWFTCVLLWCALWGLVC